MHAFTTSWRRAFQFWGASALSVACATQIDESPNQGGPLSGSAGASGSTQTAGSGAESTMETAGSGGSAGAMAGGSGGMSAGGGGGMAAGGGGTSGGVAGSGGHAGSGGAAGAAGSAGQAGASGGVSGSGGTLGAGGVGGKASGGSSGSGGSGGSGGSSATQTCAKNPITAKSTWVITASSSDGSAPTAQARDNMLGTRWATGKPQAGGEWLQVDFGATVTLTKLTLQLGPSIDDWPRQYATRFSGSSMNNAAPVLASGMGAKGTDTVMTFPTGTTGRYVLINQSGVAAALWWSVAEIQAQCAD